MFSRPGFGRLAQAVVVCVLGVLMLGAGDTAERRFQRVGHNLMCTCGCAQVLLECNHVGCPDSPGLISELHTELGGGASDGTILKWFAAKYGATVLAAPLRGGFDIVAWITPMAVFVLAIVGTGLLISVWKRRTGFKGSGFAEDGPRLAGGAGGAARGMDEALRERIRRETEY